MRKYRGKESEWMRECEKIEVKSVSKKDRVRKDRGKEREGRREWEKMEGKRENEWESEKR